jgi:hypothetical protein
MERRWPSVCTVRCAMSNEHVEPTAIDVAIRVGAAVASVGGSYFVGGSLASSLQGEPRATNDVDIVLELPLGRIREFVAALGSDFEVDVDTLREALLTGTSCNIFFLPVLTKVDLFGVGPSPYDELEFSRKRPVLVREPDVSLVVKSPEDTVLRKLWWFRKGGEVSERQWRDVVQVLRFSGQGMDDAYLERWADGLGVADLMQRARAEVLGGT